MKYLPISTFNTIDRETHSRLLPDTSLSDGENIIFRNSKVKTRWGYESLGSGLPFTGDVLGLIEYSKLRTDEKTLVGVISDRIYELDYTTEAWTQISPAYNTGTVDNLFGTAADFEAGATVYPCITSLSSSKIAVACGDDGDSGKGKCVLATISGTTSTFGSEVEFEAGDTNWISICKTDTDKIAISYADAGDSNKGKCIIATISGTVPSFGTAVEFEAGETRYTSICEIDTDKIAIAYKDQDDSGKGKCIIATISGTTPSFGTAVEFEAGETVYINISKIDTDKIAIAYVDLGDSSKGKCILATVSGTTPSFGTAVEFEAGTTIYPKICTLSTTKIAVAYSDVSDSSKGKCIVATVAGTVPSFGTAVEFEAGDADYISICALDDSSIMISYADAGDSNKGKCIIASISGTVPTFGTETDFESGTTETMQIINLSSTGIAIAFRDAGDSNKGKCILYDKLIIHGSGTTWGTTWPASTYLIKFGTDDLEGVGTPDTWFTVDDVISTTELQIDSEIDENDFMAASTDYVIRKVFISTDTDYYDTCNIIEGLGGSDEKQVILTNGVDPIWLYQGAGYCDALDMTGDGGSAPIVTARYCAYYHGHLIFGWCNDGTNDLPQSLYWDYRGYPTYWSTGSASYADLIQGDDWITDIRVLKERLYIYKEDSIVECYYTGLTSPAFEFTEDKVKGIGAFPRTVVDIGGVHIFRSKKNIHMFDGFQPTNIGDKVIRDILAREDPDYKDRSFAIHLNLEFIYGIGIVDKHDTKPYAGSIANFAADTTTQSVITDLSSSAMAIAFRDEGDSNTGYCIVATVSGTTPTYGSETQFETGAVSHLSICALSSSKIAIAYADDGDSSKGKCIVATISGTTLTFGSAVEFEAGATTYTSITALDSSTIAISYRDGTDTYGKCIIATVSGTTPSFGTAVNFYEDDVTYTDIDLLSSTKLAIVYADASDVGKCIVATISGTVPTFGTAKTFETGTVKYPRITAIDSHKIAIAYQDDDDSDQGKCVIGRVNGTVPTFRNIKTFETGTTTYIDIAALSTTRIAISYRDEDDSNKGKLILAECAEMIPRFGDAVTIETGSTTYTGIAALSTTKMAIAYTDVGDSSYGKSILATCCTVPGRWYWYNYVENSWAPQRPAHRMTAFCLNDDNEVILGDEDGYVYKIDYTAEDDDGTDIYSWFKTKDFPLNDYKQSFDLNETDITHETNEGSIQISNSLDFGDSYCDSKTIDQDTAQTINESVVNWDQRGERIKFMIENVSGSKYAIETLLIGYDDAGYP